MNDPIESAISRLTDHYLNHADDLYATQIVSLAIQLCPNGAINQNDINAKIEMAIQLVDNAKKSISKKKMETKMRH